MKIAFVVHHINKSGGQERVYYEIVRAALERGHELFLLTGCVPEEFQNHPKVNWVRIPFNRRHTILLAILTFAWESFLWLKSNQNKLDLVHTNGFVTWASSNVTAIHMVHGWRWKHINSIEPFACNIRSIYQWLFCWVNACLEQLPLRSAKQIICVSELVASQLLEVGVAPERIRVIANGVDLQEFAPGPVERRNLGLPDGVLLALFVGDIHTKGKNLDLVLQAMLKIPELHLAVAGSTERSIYPEMAERLGLRPRVHFLGFRKDIADLMRAADLFVFPSRYEAFGLVLLEALASGLPVITAETAGAATIVKAAGGMVIEDPDDVDALTGCLQSVQHSPEVRIATKERARKEAERYSCQHMAQEYVDLYESMVSGKL